MYKNDISNLINKFEIERKDRHLNIWNPGSIFFYGLNDAHNHIQISRNAIEPLTYTVEPSEVGYLFYAPIRRLADFVFGFEIIPMENVSVNSYQVYLSLDEGHSVASRIQHVKPNTMNYLMSGVPLATSIISKRQTRLYIDPKPYRVIFFGCILAVDIKISITHHPVYFLAENHTKYVIEDGECKPYKNRIADTANVFYPTLHGMMSTSENTENLNEKNAHVERFRYLIKKISICFNTTFYRKTEDKEIEIQVINHLDSTAV